MRNDDEQDGGFEVAIIGMAGRFPGARTVQQFWENIRDGVESLTTFTDDELLAAGEDPKRLAHPNYVKARQILQDMELFDAAFFGFSPKEAAIMDPQHRHFLEVSWEALEHAGLDPSRFDGRIGVYAGSGHNAYMPYNLLTNPDLIESVGFFLIRHTGNDKDFLSTRVSYCLDLDGPSINVQTACSTSLVSVHMASQSLLGGECDVALAGGVTVELPHARGYQYEPGEILSPDGHCRSFDANSQGTVFGSGVGVVVLKRLDDALRDNDCIHAVIRGSAVNNDGSGKVSYLAPSVDGQAIAIADAIEMAGISADDIGMVEAHGTGTPVGDPIEIAALSSAFRQTTEENGYCAIGSVKSNVGHLDTAAGVASLIKAVSAVEHAQIPPTLFFESPNPACSFDTSPFYVNAELRDWPEDQRPRRAGVSSLGVGGTNVHVILEEAPARPATDAAEGPQLLLLSAKSKGALQQAASRLADHLHEGPDANIADVAYTLAVGRQQFGERRFVVAGDHAGAIAALEAPGDSASYGGERPSVVFMFPGGGAQYPNMARGLYEAEPVFAAQIDRCLQILETQQDLDLRALLYPDGDVDAAKAAMLQPSKALPALFSTEIALAKLWMHHGVNPEAMIGHSLGEYAAAHLAGVISLEDALSMVTTRGRLFETLPEGGMLSVALPPTEVEPLLGDDLDFAAINAEELCVASGPVAGIERLQRLLEAREVDSRRVKINVAAHSSLLEPIIEAFTTFVQTITYHVPQRPFVSNVTGTWIRDDEATDPLYWVRHLRSTVRFAEGLSTLAEDGPRVLLEVGPGSTLATFGKAHPAGAAAVVTSLRHPKDDADDRAFARGVLGQLWCAGVELDWAAVTGDAERRRIPLPSYPFEHQRHWIEPGKQAFGAQAEEAGTDKLANIDDWFYLPSWRASVTPVRAAGGEPERVLMFIGGDGEALAERLRTDGHDVVEVRQGDAFTNDGGSRYSIRASDAADYEALLDAVVAAGGFPTRIVHLWTLASAASGAALQNLDDAATASFYSLLHLAQAFGGQDLPKRVDLSVISSCMQRLPGDLHTDEAKALLLGPCRVIGKEYPEVRCRSIDVPAALPLIEQLVAEVTGDLEEPVVAYRGFERFTQTFDRAPVGGAVTGSQLKQGGVYLITGGLGGIGLHLAQTLAKTHAARLILGSRSALPDKQAWQTWLDSHPATDPTSAKIRKVQAMEANGAQVMVAAADVADLDGMIQVVAAAKARFGRIDGVLHAAGVLNDGVIQSKTRAEAEAVLAPKVRGTLVLDRVLEGEPLDFFCLFSSVSSIIAAAGQVDYAAANAFIDAFAKARAARTGQPTIAVNWGPWQQIGMAAERARELGITADPIAFEGLPASHPLFEQQRRDDDAVVFATHLSTATHWLVDEHRIEGGKALIPGTGYLELARAALAESAPNGNGHSKAIELSELSFIAPFVVNEGESRALRLRLSDSGAFNVLSLPDGVAEFVHVEGCARFVDAPPRSTVDLQAIQARCTLERDGPNAAAGQQHLVLGPRWRNLQHVHLGELEALVRLEIDPAFRGDLADYTLHPAVLDMATAGVQSLIPDFDPEADFYVPIAYGKVLIHAPLPAKVFSHVRLDSDVLTDRDFPVYQVTLLDESGSPLVEISDFAMTRVDRQAMADSEGGDNDPSRRIPEPVHRPGTELLQEGLRNGILPSEGAEVLFRALSGMATSQLIASAQDFGALRRAADKPPEVAVTTEPKRRDLAPLEAALIAHEAVAQAVAEEYGHRERRLVAYVTFGSDDEPTGSELRRYLKKTLPNTLIPAMIVDLDELPMDASGAVDRAALPIPEGLGIDGGAQFMPPKTPTQMFIAGLWKESLGIERVGLDDNFFNLGGHSLLSLKILRKIEKKTGRKIHQRELVIQSLGQLASLVGDDAAEIEAAQDTESSSAAATKPQAPPAPQQQSNTERAAPSSKGLGRRVFDAIRSRVGD